MLPQREIGDRAGESPSLVVTITTGLELSPEWQLFDHGSSPARIDGATDSDTPRESLIPSSSGNPTPTNLASAPPMHATSLQHHKLLPVPSMKLRGSTKVGHTH